jgi:hypothetical protein
VVGFVRKEDHHYLLDETMDGLDFVEKSLCSSRFYLWMLQRTGTSVSTVNQNTVLGQEAHSLVATLTELPHYDKSSQTSNIF